MGGNYCLKNAQLVQSESNFKGLDHFKFLCNTVKEASLLWQALEKVSNSQKVSNQSGKVSQPLLLIKGKNRLK